MEVSAFINESLYIYYNSKTLLLITQYFEISSGEKN